MRKTRCHWRSCILCLYICLAAAICDARHLKTSSMNARLAIYMPPVSTDSSNTDLPFSLTPYQTQPTFCVNPPPPPPYVPQTPPSTTIPNPIGEGGYTPSPLPPSTTSPVLPSNNPPPTPICIPQTPPTILPNPPSPPQNPPYFEPTPTTFIPSPPEFVPGPTIFLPPIVYPPPAVPPPRHMAPNMALWCVAKPSVPEPIIQEAMNYACAYGAGCEPIMPNGPCSQPDTVLAHASYAFNSYWQQTKVGGGTCEFGGSAMLVMEDPSYDGCHFIYY